MYLKVGGNLAVYNPPPPSPESDRQTDNSHTPTPTAAISLFSVCRYDSISIPLHQIRSKSSIELLLPILTLPLLSSPLLAAPESSLWKNLLYDYRHLIHPMRLSVLFYSILFYSRCMMYDRTRKYTLEQSSCHTVPIPFHARYLLI